MQVFKSLVFSAFLVATVAAGNPAQQQGPPKPGKNAPTVNLKNGPYYGVYDASYKQDRFLGIRYAEPPLGELRFQNPKPYNATWKDPKNATEFSPQCYGYGSDQWVLGNIVSEDCLTLNVVRPRGYSEGAELPVAVWIHGGGYFMGGSRDPRYNFAYIVDQGVQMHKPFIGVSINYRLHGFGFLWGSEVKKAGVANLGLKDQRLALQWVQDNIAKFGGDAKRVTIFGESAGGGAVENQLLAYGGRDDHLFRGAIVQSLWRVTSNSERMNTSTFDVYYNNITKAAGCGSEKDTLACLRKVPSQKLSDIFNSTVVGKASFFPAIDGDFIQEADSQQLAKGKFVKVPLLHGQNSDEGAAFGAKGINTEDDFIKYVKSTGRSDEEAKILSKLYPDIPEIGVPSTLHGRPPAGSPLGVMYKRAAAYGGDNVMHAGRRYMSQMWAKYNASAYAYDFDVVVNGMPPFVGAVHFQEVAFVFYNIKGEGYENVVSVNPFKNMPPTYPKLAKMMSRMWISFFVDQTPNHSGVAELEWPVYKTEDAQILVFDTNVTKLAYARPDTYRAEAIAYLHSLYN